jgi:hypothetical protein
MKFLNISWIWIIIIFTKHILSKNSIYLWNLNLKITFKIINNLNMNFKTELDYLNLIKLTDNNTSN